MSELKSSRILLVYGAMIIMFVSCKKDVTSETIIMTSFNPVSGTAGNKVIIKGRGFGNTIDSFKLFFNATEANISSLTDTIIVTQVPQGATTGRISVSSAGRSAKSEQDFVILPGTWIRKSDMPAPGRIFASAFSIDDKGYVGNGFVFDGNGAGPVLNDWWQYDPVSDQWISKAGYPGGKRSNAVAFVINNIGYVGTGWDDMRIRKKDFWSYDPVNDLWTRKSDFPGPERIDAVGFGIGNKGYAGTGDAIVGSIRVKLKDWWEYDALSDQWTQKTDFPGLANQYTSGFVIQDKIYMGLGLSVSGSIGKEWWEYDPSTDQWKRKADFPGSAYNNTFTNCSFVIGNKGYVLRYAEKAEFWQYDPATDQWNEQAFFDPLRMSSIAFSIGNKGYLGTGTGSPPLFPNPWTPATKDIWQFSPSQ